MRKPAFCICENKDADQLRGNRNPEDWFSQNGAHLCHIDVSLAETKNICFVFKFMPNLIDLWPMLKSCK